MATINHNEPKPTCKLIGTDDNAFSIIAAVNRSLKKACLPEQAKEFSQKAMAGSYEELLALCWDYVEIE